MKDESRQMNPATAEQEARSAKGLFSSFLLHPSSFLFDHPLLMREVRTRMRGTRTFVIVFVYDLVLILFMGLVYAGVTSRSSWQYSNVELGRTMFGWVSYAQLALMLLIAPGLTSGAIATERERRSLDVMAISLLTPREIVWGKLLASTSFSVILLVSSVPLIGLCFMFGGLGPVELGKTLTLTVASILFYSSVALVFSAACKRTVVAVVLTFVTVLACTLGIPLLLVLFSEVFPWIGDDWLTAAMLASSPFALFTVVFPHEIPSIALRDAMWWLHSALHTGLAIALLAVAARFLTYPRAKE
jgi:ABC-type transport system involved in multi-copper enzyme maturation permease subunit